MCPYCFVIFLDLPCNEVNFGMNSTTSGQKTGRLAQMNTTPGSASVHDMSCTEAHVLSEKASSWKKRAMEMKDATQPLYAVLVEKLNEV